MNNQKRIEKAYSKAMGYDDKGERKQVKAEVYETIVNQYNAYFDRELKALGFNLVSDDAFLPRLFIHPAGMVVMQYLFFVEGYYKCVGTYGCDHFVYYMEKIDNRGYFDDLDLTIFDIKASLNSEIYDGDVNIPKKCSNPIFKDLYKEAVLLTDGFKNFDTGENDLCSKNGKRPLTR